MSQVFYVEKLVSVPPFSEEGDLPAGSPGLKPYSEDPLAAVKNELLNKREASCPSNIEQQKTDVIHNKKRLFHPKT